MVDTGYGLGGSLGDCRLAFTKGRKYKWLKHKLRATIAGQKFEQTDGRSKIPFLLRSFGGWLVFVKRLLGGSLKLSSSGLTISLTNLIVQNL